ncbi:MAG: hypothetical protein D6B25_19200 [Desulfobulbaceae bacterium]|nr:MAG: hypothetical protein D6B25_19200 [Desulfobulbaceae bacterium]
MESLVEELKAAIPFKPTTEVDDIVLIVGQDPKILVYAIVTSINRDSSKKDEWWNIGLTLLSIPLQKVVWTLRTEQMTGQEIFTMGGEKRFFKAVDFGKTNHDEINENSQPSRGSKNFLKRVK